MTPPRSASTPTSARYPSDLEVTLRLDEQLLVERVRAGDSMAFEAVFRLYRREMLALAEQILDSRGVGEEIIQDIFLSIWDGRTRWHVTTSLRAYLRRATYNAAARYATAKRNAACVSVADVERGHSASHADPSPAPDALAESAAFAEAVETVVREMPPRMREVFTLRQEDGLSNREIALRLGVSVKTVEMHITRAFALLRTRLAGWHE